MSTFDLTESFVSLVALQDEQHAEFRLAQNLGKVNVVLTGFAESLGLGRDQVSALHVCANSERLHPALLKYINSLDKTDAYKGQSVSRIKKLVRHLPWTESQADAGPVLAAVIEEQLPRHLGQVWSLLPKMRDVPANARTAPAENRSDGEATPAPPLSLIGISLGLILLRVSKALDISDIKTLLEDCSEHIYKEIRRNCPPPRRNVIVNMFLCFRQDVRDFLDYRVDKQTVTIPLDELPEPLRTQVLTYKDRAERGFGSGDEIKRIGMSKYGLDLGRLSQERVTDLITLICLGVGYIPNHMYGENLDLKDLMRLSTREIELDGVEATEHYNPLIDHYRERETRRESRYKEKDYDSCAFEMFVEALCAVAAYNGFFKLRELFKQAYKTRLDGETLKRRKRHKKEVFDREWLDRQISHMKQRFHRIADEGTFKSKPDGRLSADARDDLNLCLFYVALLILRFLGVRQQCARDCVVGENVIFSVGGCVTFKWKEEETKNGKGLTHRLSMELHSEILGDLIDAVWTYKKKIYPYISGEKHSDESPALKEMRRRDIGGQFVVKARVDGLCVPFTDANDFSSWFTRQSLKYLDFEGRLDEIYVPPSPHFYRGMFGDWLRHDKKCSAEVAATMAGDTEKVFEEEYVYQLTTYDATDTWTRLNQETRNQREGKSASEQDETLGLRELVKAQAEFIKQLQEQIK